MTDPMPTSRNRTLFLGLAGAGLFLAGFQAGTIFNSLYPFWAATAPRHSVRMAVVDEDGGTAAARIKSELLAIKTLSVSETVEDLVYSFAVRTITTDVLESDPKLGLKYRAMVLRKAIQARDVLHSDAPPDRGETP